MTTTTGECILAPGSRDTYGYGRVRVGGRTLGAHRYAWIQKHGPVAKGLVVDHLCRNRACINTDHMELVTMRENIIRGTGGAARNARKTHCKRGHEFNKKNTRIDGDGKRICRICRAEFERNKRRRKKR